MTIDQARTAPLVLVRRIGASSARLFAAWTEPALMARWFAPEPFRVSEVEADARVGGRYRIAVAEPGRAGPQHVTTGEYIEIVPNRRLVKTWSYRGPNPEFGEQPTLLTVELIELGPKLTDLKVTHRQLPNERAHAGTHAGWLSCLDALDDLNMPEQRFVTERKVKASVEEAYAAWTEPALLRRWFGTVVEADVRVGGKYRVENHEDGQVFKHKGEYRVLEPGRRIVKTFAFDGEGELAEYAKDFVDEMVTVTFRSLGPKLTLVTLTNSWNGRVLTSEEDEKLGTGWGDWLGRFERALTQPAGS